MNRLSNFLLALSLFLGAAACGSFVLIKIISHSTKTGALSLILMLPYNFGIIFILPGCLIGVYQMLRTKKPTPRVMLASLSILFLNAFLILSVFVGW